MIFLHLTDGSSPDRIHITAAQGKRVYRQPALAGAWRGVFHRCW
jgi:hypothetical protein